MIETPNIILYFLLGNITLKYLLNYIFNIELTKQSFYSSLFMSLFITYFRKPINYDLTYILSQNEDDYTCIQLQFCLLVYLYEDLLFSKNNKSLIFHHIECISGLLISLNLNICVGYLNNSLSNEISTIFLNIYILLKKKQNKTLSIIKNISFILFYITFILYRIIILTKLNYIIFYENIELFKTIYPIYSSFLFVNSFSHLILQYYWFLKINNILYKQIMNVYMENIQLYKK